MTCDVHVYILYYVFYILFMLVAFNVVLHARTLLSVCVLYNAATCTYMYIYVCLCITTT